MGTDIDPLAFSPRSRIRQASPGQLSLVAPVDAVYDSPSEYVYLTVSTVAFLAVVGVWALKSRTDRLRRLAAVATCLVGIGYGAMALLNVVNLVVGARSLVMVRLGFALVMLIGAVILGVNILRTHLLPWWCGVLMIIAFPLGHFANAVFANRVPPPDLDELVGRIGPRPVLLIRAENGVGGDRPRGPTAELWRVPGSSHLGGYDAQPEAYEQRVSVFFDRALLRRGR